MSKFAMYSPLRSWKRENYLLIHLYLSKWVRTRNPIEG
jgi:hypothetical protein